MARSKTTANLFQKKTAKVVRILHEALAKAIGDAEQKGCWIVYGSEKNGKTWFTLLLVKALAIFEPVNYISAEEGLDESFRMAVKRAGITTKERIYWDEYMTIDEIIEKHKKQRSPDILVIDNLTIYQDEIKPSELKKTLIDALSNKLIILIAHEERKEAYPALAKMAKKMAKVIFHVEGLKVFITSRFSKGGELIIDEEKSEIYWGE